MSIILKFAYYIEAVLNIWNLFGNKKWMHKLFAFWQGISSN